MRNIGTISIKEVRTSKELKQAQKIREEVLEREQGFPHDVNIDGLDPSADHVLVLDDEVPVATARLTISMEGEGKIARIALLPGYRGTGLGKRVMRKLEIIAKRHRLQTLFVEPHAHLEPFFRNLGYEKVPGSVELAGHHLIKMMKRL